MQISLFEKTIYDISITLLFTPNRNQLSKENVIEKQIFVTTRM